MLVTASDPSNLSLKDRIQLFSKTSGSSADDTSATMSKSRCRSTVGRGMTRRRSWKVSAKRLPELLTKYIPQEYEKTEEDKVIIHAELARNFIFKKVTAGALEDMLKAFEPIDHYKKGDVIIEQNDVGDYFYILGKGSVLYEVDGRNVGGADKQGASFGELALLYSSPRKATVRANSDEMRVYRVDHMTFRYILQSRSKFKAMYMQAVTKVKALNRLLAMVDLKALSHHTKSTYDDDGLSCGDDDDDLSAPTEPKFLSAGYDDAHPDEQDWLELSERRRFIRSSIAEDNVSSDTFRRSSILGEGQFGEVWLVQPTIEEVNDEEFALKVQSKENMNRANMDYSAEEAIKRECDVLQLMCHPFIVDFVTGFEDEANIYMVMGAIKGKELWEYIHREQDDGAWVSGLPTEDHAKFYTFVVADTLNYMHRQHVCHRDVKPENILINETGYPILVDFGFAKKLPGGQGKTYTLCGTPKYTAPEIISNEGHGCEVDFWALGVVAYEMISGENPFYYDGIPELQLFDDICNVEPYPIQQDADCSEESQDIIQRMLTKDPMERLVGKDVINHPWFDGMDITKTRKQELQAPAAP